MYAEKRYSEQAKNTTHFRCISNYRITAKETIEKTMLQFQASLFFILLAAFVRSATTCFPVNDVFEFSSLWKQTTSVGSYLYFAIGQEKRNKMTVESQDSHGNVRMKSVYCVKSKGDNRYLVRVEEVYRKTYFQCYKFQPLTPNVVRWSKSKTESKVETLKCDQEAYKTDEAVLITWHDIPSSPCPLIGGYQLILHQSLAISGSCLDTVQHYNPRIQFECDKKGSGNVITEFGDVCMPKAAKRMMRARHLTNLKCISSWTENNYTSVVLQIRDESTNFWCLHFKPYSDDHYETVGIGDKAKMKARGEFYNVYLTLDGKCSALAFGDSDLLSNTSMFGFMASYRDESEPECSDKKYLQSCKNNDRKCFESSQCPSVCNRCKQKLKRKECTFDGAIKGKWKMPGARYGTEFILDVSNTSFSTSDLGSFECMGPHEKYLAGKVFPVVQFDENTSCMPYYACAELDSPAYGVLNFHLRPALRDIISGKRLSCTETYDTHGWADMYDWVDAEKTYTMLNEENLKTVSCGIDETTTYPSLNLACQLVLQKCTGACSTVEVRYDTVTCGNDSSQWPFPLDDRHTCHAAFTFMDGIKGLIVQSESSGAFRCWLFSSTRWFVTSHIDCNPERVRKIYNDIDALQKYDPLQLLGMSVAFSSSHAEFCRPSFLLVYLFILFTVLNVCTNYRKH